MFVKKIGYLLLVKLKLFTIIAKVSPLLMVGSLLMIYLMVGVKQQYKFQEPSLRSKIYDVSSKITNDQIQYKQAYEGIHYSRVEGLLDNECILIAFPSSIEQHEEIRNIYSTLANQNHNSKSIALLSYKNVKTLQLFFEWYFSPNQNIKFSLGIIRAGINIEIRSEVQSSRQQNKDKAYFKMYTSSLHADSDYFQSIKQLLQKLNIVWAPCQQIHKSTPLKMIKKVLTLGEEAINGQRSLKLFYDHVLCQLNQHLNRKVSAHEVMLVNGFQAASVKFVLYSNQMKVAKLVVSFVNEFGMQQDHLHSSSAFYYPLSKVHFVPMNFTLYPSILFFISLAINLLYRYIDKDYKNQFQIDSTVLTLIYVMMTEYYILQDYNVSILLAAILVLVSISQQLRAIIGKKDLKINRLYEIAFLAIQGLIAIYFGVFCFALSYVAMLLSIIMLIKPTNTIIRVSLKFKALLLLVFWIYSNSFMSFYQQIIGLSAQLKLFLIVALVHYSL